MTDPTVTILKIAFLAALAFFVIVAGIRAWKARRITGPGVILDEFGNPPVFPPAIPVGKVPVWPYVPVDFLWMGFIFLVFFGLVIGDASTDSAEKAKKLSAAALVISIGFQLVTAFLTILFVARRIAPSAWLGLKWTQWRRIFWMGPVCVVAMWTVFIALRWVGNVFWTVLAHLQSTGVTGWTEKLMAWMRWFDNENAQESIKLLQSTQDPVILALMAIAAVIVAPVCEEIVFRGYLYPAAKKFAGPWVAGICSALVFAAAHGNLPALLPLFIFGCVLVVLYEKTGSILLPIAVHLCFNGATVAVQMLDRVYHFSELAPT